MVTTADARRGTGEQTVVVDLEFPGEAGEAAPFSRADLVVEGLDHSGLSYEVRLYLNDPDASIGTPRDAAHGYAGRLTVFGHGGCYGDEGHCEVPEPSADPTEFRPRHQLAPMDTFVTVTEALRRIVTRDGGVRTVTLVPVSLPPRRADRAPAPELLQFTDLSLQTYLTPADADDAAER